MTQLRHGAALAGYRIEALIGEGSTGAVYSALDVALDRRVALKVLLPELARDPRFRERFLRESKVAASLEHPNIVPIHAVGEADGVLFIAMRYVDGRDLSSILQQVGRLDPERVVGLLSQVASALDAAHERGLVHRDVKPANILLARHGEREHAYLCDFGLAKHTSTVTSLTGERSVVGTVDYLAPEQIDGLPVDGRVDVYGLGCVLFECLAGAPPYGRENEIASLLAHLKEPIPRITERRPELPRPLDDVFAAVLAKNRDERYPTCGAMIAAAETALGGEAPERPEPPPKPAATLQTFVFCDIRGYTAYTREQGDEAAAALASTFAGLVGALAPEFDGRLHELRGDEALIVFASARQALRFALALQQRVADDELPRGVGVGLDAGEAVAVADGYRGGALNRAARLCALAGPGDVLASDGVVHLAGKVEGIAYARRRSERLKGFDEPVTLVEVVPAGASRARTRRRLSRGSRRVLMLALGALLVVAAAVAAVLTLTGGEGEEGGQRTGTSAQPVSAAVPANSVVSFDPATGKPGASIAGQTAWAFVTGEDAVYGLDPNQQYLVEIDSANATVQNRIPVDRPHRFLPTVEFGSIWYTTEDGDEVVRADPVFHRTVARIKLPAKDLQPNFGTNPGGVARVGDEIWVTYGYPARVARIDPADNEVIRTWRLPDGPPVSTNIVAGGGDIWALYDDGSAVMRLSAAGEVEATGKLAGGGAVAAVAAEGYLWVAMDASGGVWKLDRDASVRGQIRTGAGPWEMIEADGYLWVSNSRAGTVSRLDPRTDAVRQTKTGHRPLGVAVTGERLWVGLELSAAEGRAAIEGDRVISVALAEGTPVTDPAATNDIPSLVLAHSIGVGLMRYQPAPDGTAEIIPELAAGPPEVSDDLRRYTFTVLSGFRFSPPSGEPVTAETVRYSLERAIAEEGFCNYLLGGDVVGAAEFQEGNADHVAGISVEGETISIELTAPSATLPARLASPCATVVPVGTPVSESQAGLLQPIASAGPYYVDTHAAGEQLVVLPNPNYAGTRSPQLDGIVFAVAGDPERAAVLVEQGRADLVADVGEELSPAFSFDGRLERQFGQEDCLSSTGEQPCFVRPPSNLIRFIQLDTRRGMLADPDVRRAFSIGLDRETLARLAQGYPITRLIGPGVPGHAPAPLVPARGDAATARGLMDGRSATVRLGFLRFAEEDRRVASAIRDQLEPVGIRVVLEPSDDSFAEAVRPGTKLTGLFAGWALDFADPENMIYLVVSPRSPDYFFPPWFTNEALLDEIDEALAVVGPGRPPTWRAIDESLAEEAAFIPLYTDFSYPQLFSSRVGCQIFLPLYSGLVDLGSLCLR